MLVQFIIFHQMLPPDVTFEMLRHCVIKLLIVYSFACNLVLGLLRVLKNGVGG